MMSKSIEMDGFTIVIREYDFDNDPEKIVKYLYDKMQGDEGIKILKQADMELRENYGTMRRFVAEIDGEIHSSCVMIRGTRAADMEKYYLYSMVTSSAYRGKGLSAELVDFVTDWAREQQSRMIVLSTHASNERAIAFYEKVGFKKFGSIPNGIIHNGKYEDEVFFFRPIT